MKYLAEGLYYRVYQISENKVLKIEKSYFAKQIIWLRWFCFSEFFKNIMQPFSYYKKINKHLESSKTVALRAPHLIGNPLFIKEYDYEQDLVAPLKDYFNKHNEVENKKYFDLYLENTLQTWRHGFADIVFNFTLNNGVDKNGNVILHDFNEIVFEKQNILSRIKEKQWLTQNSFKSMPEGSLKAYARKRLNETFTEENLNLHWKEI